MRPVLSSLALLFALIGCSSSEQENAFESPPLNIILFVVDDLGWRDAGVLGSEFYDTPAIGSGSGLQFVATARATNSVEQKQPQKGKSEAEQDSGYLTTPAVSSEEENSSDQNKNPSSDTDRTSETVPGTCTTPSSATSPKHSLLTPKLAALNVTPKLSGSPDSFIDLDDEVTTPSRPVKGFHSLMERLMKHSTKRKKAAQDVELR